MQTESSSLSQLLDSEYLLQGDYGLKTSILCIREWYDRPWYS